jgi:RNA polymerase sigma factor (sigma-70 family)
MDQVRRTELFGRCRARYAGYMAAVLWKLTGDRELFAEAMQYAMVGLWQHVEQLESDKATAYLYRIMLSANSKAWRQRVGRDGRLARDPGLHEGPERQSSNGELVTVVRQAISRLPAKQAQAVTMRYLEQREYDDIARQLGCSEAGARSHVAKAVAALKSKLTILAEQR